MKNRKGFTLTEILVTLLILGVILVIAVPTFGKVLENFKKNFYKQEENMLLEAGKEYFNDKKTLLPSEYLHSKVVYLNDFGDKKGYLNKYLDKNLTKYRSNDACNNDSYVVVIKDKDKYIYQECLTCGDDYSTNTNKRKNCSDPTKDCDTENYCSSSWSNNNNIEYNWGQNGNVYLYAGNYTREELRNKLAINTKTIIKKDLKSFTIKTDKFYPSGNISIDPNFEKKVDIEYSVPEFVDNSIITKTNLQLIVYKHPSPIINTTIENNIIKISESSVIPLFELVDTFNYKYMTESGEEKNLSNFLSYQVSENNGNWEDIEGCSEIKSCNYNSKDGVKTVKFRVLGQNNEDDKIEIGKETISYEIKRVYKLTYYNQGGSGCTTQEGIYGSVWGTLCTPKRTGYVFNGWYTKDNVKIISSTIVNKSLDVYASWSPITYIVRHNANNGSGSYIDTTCTYNVECTIGYNTFSRSGYYFNYWYSSTSTYKEGKKVLNLASTQNAVVNLYANWLPYSYALTYDSDNGSYCAPIVRSYGSNWGTLCEPIKENYTFEGWYTGRNGTGTKITSDTMVTGNLVVYAYWIPYTYTLTYINNGGSGCSSKTGTYGNTWGTLCVPTKSGSIFNGWETSNRTQVTSGTEVTDDVTVYAKWAITDTSGPICDWYGPYTNTSYTTININASYGDIRYYRLECRDPNGINGDIVVGSSANATKEVIGGSSKPSELIAIYKVTVGTGQGTWALGVENAKDNLGNYSYRDAHYATPIKIQNLAKCPDLTVVNQLIPGTIWYKDKITLNVVSKPGTKSWDWYTNSENASTLTYNGITYQKHASNVTSPTLSAVSGRDRYALIKVSTNYSDDVQTCTYGPYKIDAAPSIYAYISTTGYDTYGRYLKNLEFYKGEWKSAMGLLQTYGYWENTDSNLSVKAYWADEGANAISIETKNCFNSECNLLYKGCAQAVKGGEIWYTDGHNDGKWSSTRINPYYKSIGIDGSKNYYKYSIKAKSITSMESAILNVQEHYSGTTSTYDNCTYK